MNNYEKVLGLKVFNFKDLCNLIGNENSAKSLLKNMLQKNYVKKIKYNLYAVCDLEYKNAIPSPYMIGSKIKEDSCISYHSAFEYYGAKNQVFYLIYVSSKKNFEEFEFEGYTYTYINNKYDFGIINDGKIRVTDKERTVIDCIDKTEFAGGHEELILCLELMRKLDGNKILKYLSKYNSKKLYAKVGFMLELLKSVFGMEEEVIKECKRKSENLKYYFDNETKTAKNKYIKDWNLIVPEIFVKRGETLYW